VVDSGPEGPSGVRDSGAADVLRDLEPASPGWLDFAAVDALAADYRPGQAERELQQRLDTGEVRDLTEMQKAGPGASSDVYKGKVVGDGADHLVVYKPDSSHRSLRDDIPAEGLADREVAAARTDDMLGYGLTQATVVWDGEGAHGRGSVQSFVVDRQGGRPLYSYGETQTQRMAVFDYIIGNTDRHRLNYLTGPGGILVGIDHALSFPETSAGYLRSMFIEKHFNQDLDPAVLAAARALDRVEFAAMLRATGLSKEAVTGAVARLAEIQDNGRITGDAWDGMIVGRPRSIVREAKP